MRAPKIIVPTLAACLLGICFAISVYAAPPRKTPVAASLVAQTADQKEWMKALMKADSVRASNETERLVKTNQGMAVFWIVEKAKTFLSAPSEKLETEMSALRRAWRAAVGSDFADNLYEYYSLLRSIDKDRRNELVGRYEEARSRYYRNLEKKNPVVYGVLWGELEGVAGLLSKLGDHYYASEAWRLAFSCVSKGVRGDDADLYKACKALKNVVAERSAVDLRDRSFNESSTLYSNLKAQGYDPEVGEDGEPLVGEDGKQPPKGGIVDEGPAVRAELSFNLIEKIDQFARPSYYDDELHNLWLRASLGKKDSSAKISSLGELSPLILRTGSAEALIDVDGDGTGDVKVPLNGNIAGVQFKVGEGEEARDWGFLATVGTTSDMYQHIQVNMVFDDDQMALYMHPAASMVGSLEGIPLRLIDENMDGIYGGPPTVWNHDGLSDGLMHPEFDSVVIDNAKRALPWSEYQKIGDLWYRLEIERAGTAIVGHVVPMQTGKIKLSFKGTKPRWLVVQGTGKYEDSYFDLMQKGLELPVGGWKLYCGEVRKGKKVETLKSLILPGEGQETWTVVAGKTTKAELGGPFGFDFVFKEDAKTLTVQGNSVVITGKHGERYERPWNCVPNPLASWRKAGSKKGSKPRKFKQVNTQDQLTEAGSWDIAWFPVSVELIKKSVSDSSEVQLTEKKNKLFGKISSSWKE